MLQTHWIQAFQEPGLDCTSSQKSSQQHRAQRSTGGSSSEILRTKWPSSIPDGQSIHPGFHPYPGTLPVPTNRNYGSTGDGGWVQTASLAGSAGLRRRRNLSGACHKIKPEYFAIICQNLQETLEFWQCLWSQTKPRTSQFYQQIPSHVRGRGAALFPHFPVVLGKHNEVKAVVWHFDEPPVYFPEEPSGRLLKVLLV